MPLSSSVFSLRFLKDSIDAFQIYSLRNSSVLIHVSSKAHSIISPSETNIRGKYQPQKPPEPYKSLKNTEPSKGYFDVSLRSAQRRLFSAAQQKCLWVDGHLVNQPGFEELLVDT